MGFLKIRKQIIKVVFVIYKQKDIKDFINSIIFLLNKYHSRWKSTN